MKLSKREIARLAEQESMRAAFREKVAGGQHRHVAEIYGDSETRGLTRWARRRVLLQGKEAAA